MEADDDDDDDDDVVKVVVVFVLAVNVMGSAPSADIAIVPECLVISDKYNRRHIAKIR